MAAETVWLAEHTERAPKGVKAAHIRRKMRKAVMHAVMAAKGDRDPRLAGLQPTLVSTQLPLDPGEEAVQEAVALKTEELEAFYARQTAQNSEKQARGDAIAQWKIRVRIMEAAVPRACCSLWGT